MVVKLVRLQRQLYFQSRGSSPSRQILGEFFAEKSAPQNRSVFLGPAGMDSFAKDGSGRHKTQADFNRIVDFGHDGRMNCAKILHKTLPINGANLVEMDC